MDDDLLDPNGQLTFPDLSETLGSELLEQPSPGVRSGKIVDQNRAKVQLILAARAAGHGVRACCKLFEISPHTLAALESRHARQLATLKTRLAGKLGVFLELGMDRVLRDVDKMDIDRLMIALGIAADKMQLLTGEATVIVGEKAADKQFSVQGLQQRLARREVNVTGSVAGESGPTREASAIDVQVRPAPSISDSVSDNNA